jgi:hypothetical protein
MSGIGHIKLRLVHAYQTDYVESGDQFVHLWRFADKADGYMDEIHELRDHYQADVAVLIVDDADGCGQATRVLQGKLRRLPPFAGLVQPRRPDRRRPCRFCRTRQLPRDRRERAARRGLSLEHAGVRSLVW